MQKHVDFLSLSSKIHPIVLETAEADQVCGNCECVRNMVYNNMTPEKQMLRDLVDTNMPCSEWWFNFRSSPAISAVLGFTNISKN